MRVPHIFALTLIECFFDRSFLAEMRDTTLVQCEKITMCFCLPARACACARACSTAKLIDGGPSSRPWQDTALTLRRGYSSITLASAHATVRRLPAHETIKGDEERKALRKCFIARPHGLLSNPPESLFSVTELEKKKKSKSARKPTWAQGRLSFLASVERD